MARLQHIQRSSHITLTQLDQRIHSITRNLDTLLIDYLLHQDPNIPFLERTEPKPRAATQQCRT